MIISKKEINGLMKLIGLTKDDEINCEQCLAQIAEFAEHELAGKTIPDGLQAVEHHLSVCSECCEEYEILKNILSGIKE
jgi:uncharacterized protein with PIN domain